MEGQRRGDPDEHGDTRVSTDARPSLPLVLFRRHRLAGPRFAAQFAPYWPKKLPFPRAAFAARPHRVSGCTTRRSGSLVRASSLNYAEHSAGRARVGGGCG